MGLLGSHRLHSLSLKPTPNAVDLEGRSNPGAFPRGVTRLPEKLAYPELLPVRCFIERNSRDLRALLRSRCDCILVEPLYQDLSLCAPHAVQQSSQRVDRILHGAAVDTGVKIGAKALNIDLQSAQPLEAKKQDGLVLIALKAVGAHHQIAGQTRAVLFYHR